MDNVNLIHPRPGRWLSAAVVAILAAMAINSLVTNPNFQWPVVGQWLFSNTIMTGVFYTLILTIISMTVGTILAITMAIMRQSPNPILRYVAWFYIWFFRGRQVCSRNPSGPARIASARHSDHVRSPELPHQRGVAGKESLGS